jgi:hypothetical protein
MRARSQDRSVGKTPWEAGNRLSLAGDRSFNVESPSDWLIDYQLEYERRVFFSLKATNGYAELDYRRYARITRGWNEDGSVKRTPEGE